MLYLQSAIDLAQGRSADVVALFVVLAAMPDRVGARRDRLRLRRFELRIELRSQLDRDDGAHIVLERSRVHDVEAGTVVDEQLERAPVAAAENVHDAPGRLEPEPPAGNPADPVDHEGGILQHPALDHDPDVVEPFDLKPAAGFLGLLPAAVAAHADPIEAGRGVEDRVRVLGEQLGETGGEPLRLPPIPEGRYLEPMIAWTRPARRRSHAETPVDHVAFAVLGHQPRGRLAAGNLQAVQVRRQSHPDLRRQRGGPGDRARFGSRNRPSRGNEQAGRRGQAGHRDPPPQVLSHPFSHSASSIRYWK